jgi:hypothetical protein
LVAEFAGTEGVIVIGNDLAPGLGAEGLLEFVLGAGEGLQEVLGEIGHGVGGTRGDVVAGDGGHGVGDGGAEVAVGYVAVGEGEGDIGEGLLGGAVVGLPAGMEGAEVGVVGSQRDSALAAIGEGEGADAGAIYG